MKARLFMTTAAAALLAAATFASAQTGGGGQGSGAGASQSGGSSGAGSSGGAGGAGGAGGMERGSAGTDRGSGPMDRGSTAAPSGDRVQTNKAAPSQRTGQSPSRSDQNQAQSPRQGDKAGQPDKNGQAGQQGDKAGQADKNGQAGRQGDRAKDNTGAAPSNVNVTSEQRTQIRQRLGSSSAARVTNVNFKVSVGVSVPRSVRLYDLPSAIVEIVPAYRSYKYIIVEEEIVIIDPSTYTIITIIES